MKYYMDSSHYRKEVGDLVLNRILFYNPNKIPNHFGVLINSQNVESHLAKISADREVWAKNNPDLVKLVLDIKKREQDQKQKAEEVEFISELRNTDK